MRAPLAAAAGLVLMLVAAQPAAAATTRYATPLGAGNACTTLQPCTIQGAIDKAEAGDTVQIGHGTYGGPSTELAEIDAAGDVDIRGEAGFPAPTIYVAGPNAFSLDTGPKLSHVRVFHHGNGPGLRLVSASADRVYVADDGTAAFSAACGLSNSTLTNSVCWSQEDDRPAVLVADDDLGTGAPARVSTLRNVTAVATGANASGIVVDQAGGADGTVNGTNVIARGPGTDVVATADATSTAALNLDHSNYATRGGDPNTITDPANGLNQAEDPLFLAAASGDFHQAATSPTVNAGITNAANGASDLDGNARAQGASTDIGAYERPVTTSKPPSSGGKTPSAGNQPSGGDKATPSSQFRFGKFKASSNGTGVLSLSVPGPGTVSVKPVTAGSSARSRKRRAYVKAVRRTVRKKGTVRLRIRPTRSGRKLLLKKGRLRVKLLVSFKPKGGKARIRRRTIKLRYSKPGSAS